ncbi:MAG: acyltransferase [Bacteroidales bacterium]|jgi:phenylacetate-coenzyme A ligase PaaK-like adenylate-forming protein|nr:acyltransferase [Bacteroidales bacterium]
MEIKDYQKRIFKIDNEDTFNEMSLVAFDYQYNRIDIYRQFVDSLKVNPKSIEHYSKIPFLPISFFKTHNIITGNAQVIFKSSGTTAFNRSQHFVKDLNLYETSFITGFENFYGSIKDYCVLALLPSYIENGDSSLVYMADKLIRESRNKDSGFYLNNLKEISKKLELMDSFGQKTLLLGVSYALLDLIDHHQFQLINTIVMETGGMKGQRKEMIREDLHQRLKMGFGLENIHSEYGMTELLSQAYSKSKGIFETPAWMKVLIRDVNDPFDILPNGQSGGINIIDLTNIYSLSFIETKDLGKLYQNQYFEILGRFDDSDIRGCNLLIT